MLCLLFAIWRLSNSLVKCLIVVALNLGFGPILSVDYSCHRIGQVAQLIDAVSTAVVLAGQLRRAVQIDAGGRTGVRLQLVWYGPAVSR